MFSIPWNYRCIRWNGDYVIPQLTFLSRPLLVRLSTGRAGLVLDPTQTRPACVGWRGRGTEIDHRKNRLVRFWVMVSVGRVELVAKIKKGIEIWKKESPKSRIFVGNWKILLKVGKYHRKLDFFYEICIFFG